MKNESARMASQIGRASAIIMIWSLVDKALAIGKEMLTAHRFGVSASLDVFNVAYSFPSTVVMLFSAALGSAIVPLYLEWRNHSFLEADSHTTWLIYLTTLLFALLSLIFFVFSPEIIQMIGYGFNPEQKQLGIIMERVLILLTFIDGAGLLFRGILSAKKMFFHLYVAPIFVNITIIIFLVYDMGLNIYVLVWGFLIGTLLKSVYMGVALFREGFKFDTPLPFDPQIIKTFWLLAIPMLGSGLIANSNLMVDQVMATQLPAGSVSTLRYAFRINDFPIQVIILAISRGIFPFISEEAAAGNLDNLQRIFKYALILLGFLTIPATALMLLFSEDIVILLLKRGAFDLEAARQTGQALSCYSLGLFFYAYTFINGSFFAALKNTKALLYMGVVSIFLNVFFNYLFMYFWGAKGIALSTSATMGIISIWFISQLKRHLGITNLSQTFSSFTRIILAAAGMLGSGLVIIKLFELTLIPRLVFIPVATAAASSCYLGIIWVFRTAELDDCITVLTNMITMWKKGRFGTNEE
ncbi:MAG: murein biosynthesis integral membrane protein MurJ [Deltaproteobacteria bacterium]|nr:murein biosynthesis integral membrane protein MurJ [Deltaproteobacteria bacterium]